MKLATLCYVKDNSTNKTLMLYRNKKENDYHEGKWNGLGGKFELGETPEECAIRELKEESGLTVKNPKLKGFITFPNFDGVDDWYVFVFVITNFEGNLIDSPEGKLEWIPNEKLTSLNLWGGDKIFLEWLNLDKFFSAKFNYKNGKFIDYVVSFY
ncbi:MAG: 8-oxo-dGTP diphosphatase [Bacteroidetes bacterium]|nr:8-oxo-dGTP diphosphatase [Bacteroidota bacterium]MCH8942985.1 8-oxo-dGTP diphosphatase [Bacteroidota bacterium]